VAYGAGLESQLGEISQGFESLILRQNILMLIKRGGGGICTHGRYFYIHTLLARVPFAT
jgi:hypothetical protein